MDVSEYILKPINAPELMDVLNKLKDQLDRQRLERRDMETLRRRYEESLPVLREMFYARLLDGQIRADLIQERAGRYEIELPQGTWAAALVQVDCLNEAGKPERDELLLLSVRAFWRSILPWRAVPSGPSCIMIQWLCWPIWEIRGYIP